MFRVCDSSCGVGALGGLGLLAGWAAYIKYLFLSFFLTALATNEVDQYW